MKSFLYVGLIILLLIFVLIVTGIRMEQTEKEVDKWAAENHYVIVSKEMNMTIFGSPFYYLNKGEYIYRVVLDNGDIWWVRTGVLSNDYEKEKKVLRN